MLKLMYITNKPEIASIADAAGVDRIFIDMEYIGKSERQGGLDTVRNHHTVEDARAVKKVLSNAQLMVRVNPIHDATSEYCSTEDEIDAVIDAGADVIMLPYFKTVEEVERFVKAVDGRARVFPLLESAKALECLDSISDVQGIDEIYIGLNDMSLDLKKKFMFELLADGTVEHICRRLKAKNIPYGFGGIGRLGEGDLPAEYVIKEHYRLGSTCAILSRSFCNCNLITDLTEIRAVFKNGLRDIREYEEICATASEEDLRNNQKIVIKKVKEISGSR